MSFMQVLEDFLSLILKMNTNFVIAVQNELLKHGFKAVSQEAHFSNTVLMPVLIKRNELCERLSFDDIKQFINHTAKEYKVIIRSSYIIKNGASFYFIGFDGMYSYRIELVRTIHSDFELDACTIDILNVKKYV